VFGLNEYLYRQKHIHQPIVINTQELINGHLLLAGMSGTGKSYQAQRLLTNAIKQNLEVDIFDVHNELDQSETSSALYSESTQLGFNLLSVSPDPHSGGVRRRINEIINMVNATSRKLGFKQETALRNLLNDVYRINGCNAYEANTWRKKEITGAIRNNLIEQRDYQGLRQYYPVMDDLLSFAERKLTSLYLGTNIKAVLALEEVNHLAKQLNRARQKHAKSTQDAQIEKTEKALEVAKSKVKAAFEAYVDHIESGNEISDVMKYNSKEVLQSVLERLNILNAAGIFHPNPPAFGDANGRCHQIKHLSDDEQSMFVSMRLESIFRQCRDSGVKPDIQHIVFVDEAHKFISEDSDNIINIIAKEGRKFGLGLWCASQSPTHFSEDFLTNCGTTILLGLHSSYWDMACRKLRIEPSVLKYIRPQQVAAIKLQLKGSMDSKFQNAIINETTLASVV
jgi:DNA helicase HerA-like ATPase